MIRRLGLLALLLLTPAWASAQTVVSFGENTGNTTGTDDAMMQQTDAATNFGSSAVMFITEWAAGDHNHTVVKWTGFPGTIPGGATITTARIRLYLTSSAGGGSHDISFYNLLNAFTENQVTWNVRQTATNWNTAGGQGSGTDHGASALFSITGMGDTTGQYYDFTATAAGVTWLQNLLDGTGGVTNHGFVSDRTAGADSQHREFGSTEGSDGQRPILEVTYTTGGGASPRRGTLTGVLP